jgi:FdhD protein
MTTALPPGRVTVAARRIDADGEHVREEALAGETPVALLYNGVPFAVMMATPADLEDFALGFSLSEGIVDDAAALQVVEVLAVEAGISLQMRIPQAAHDALAGRGRNLAGRGGCGLCGIDTLEAAIRPVRRVQGLPLPADRLAPQFAALQAAQLLNAATGAVHAAAVLDDAGCLHVREDVGRHVAVDKAIGAALRAGSRPRALLVTS